MAPSDVNYYLILKNLYCTILHYYAQFFADLVTSGSSYTNFLCCLPRDVVVNF